MTKIVALFPGQGSQAVAMGKDLYDNFKASKKVFDEVDVILNRCLSDIIFNGSDEELLKTENAQLAIMAVSVATLEALKEKTGKDATELFVCAAGNSLGEYSALYASGALSLLDTVRLLEARSRAMSIAVKDNPGVMVAVLGMKKDRVQSAIDKAKSLSLWENSVCSIANDNAIGQIVISGDSLLVECVAESLKSMGAKRIVPLKVAGAFHSSLMQSAREILDTVLLDVSIEKPLFPIYSNVTAFKTQDPVEIKANLSEQITGTVRWCETMLNMEKDGVTSGIELGHGKVISGLFAKTCPDIKIINIGTADAVQNFLE